LSVREVQEIRDLARLTRFSQRQIAEWYSTTASTVGRVKLGLSWAHVPEMRAPGRADEVMVQVYVSAAVRDRLVAEADRQGTTPSRVVRGWMEERLGVERPVEAVVRRSSAVGGFIPNDFDL
jgi:hypothetical protein